MAKRVGNGRGSVFQRKSDGRWGAAITYKDKDDIRRRRTVWATSEEDANAKLLELQIEAASGRSMASARQTVGEYLDYWLEEVAAIRLKEPSYWHYELVIRCYLKPGIGSIQLTKLEPRDVQRMITRLHRAKHTSVSIENYRAVLRTALEHAVMIEQLIPRNVAKLVEMPPKDAVKDRIELDDELVERLHAAIAGTRLELPVRVALKLGLRIGEIYGLQWKDINVKTAKLSVRHTVAFIRGREVLGEPKSAASRRTLPISPGLLARLKTHRARQNEARLQAGADWTDHDLVFPNTQGGVQLMSHTRKLLDDCCKAADLPHLHFHLFRHTFATDLAAKGTPPHVIMELMGHTNFKLTYEIYVHAQETGKRAAVEALDDDADELDQAV